MKNFFALLLLLSTSVWSDHHMMTTHDHEGHFHHTEVNGKDLEINPERYNKFISDLNDTQVAVVSVYGMVCDFCARGIEKTFLKDKKVLKVDVDLSEGKVLVAYSRDKTVDFEEIKQQILANGQTATELKVIIL